MKKDVCETVVKDPAGGKTAHRGRDKTGVKAEEEAHVWSENPHRKHAASMAAGLGRRPRPGTDISTERQQGKAPGGPPANLCCGCGRLGSSKGRFPRVVWGTWATRRQSASWSVTRCLPGQRVQQRRRGRPPHPPTPASEPPLGEVRLLTRRTCEQSGCRDEGAGGGRSPALRDSGQRYGGARLAPPAPKARGV